MFTTGGGSSDPMNYDSSEAALFNAKHLVSVKPASKSTIEMLFQAETREEIVVLTIVGGSHSKVIKAISSAIASSKDPLIKIADVDTDSFASKFINGVSIKTGTPILYYQKIVDATQVNLIPINTKLKKLNSMTLANIHSASAIVDVFLANPTDNWYIMKNVTIPNGATLKLESDELDYDAGVFNLYVKLGGSTPVDVIVR